MTNRFISDGPCIVMKGDPYLTPAALVFVLLDRLGLYEAPRDEQEAGIAKWLRDGNEPCETLLWDLGRKGFGHLLDEARPAA